MKNNNSKQKIIRNKYSPQFKDQAVVGSVTGKERFCGLSKTSMTLEGIAFHLQLIEGYNKIHQARKPKSEI